MEDFLSTDAKEIRFDFTRILDFECFSFLTLPLLINKTKKELSLLQNKTDVVIEFVEEYNVAGLRRIKNQLFYALKQSKLVDLLTKEATVQQKSLFVTTKEYDNIRSRIEDYFQSTELFKYEIVHCLERNLTAF